MNTSAPTICSTACSPLTARLSITMSLYGRRPSVVLSLVICTSLITTPSSETTSLPMLDLKSCCLVAYAGLLTPRAAPECVSAPAERPPCAALGLHAPFRASQHERNIIPPAHVVGAINQGLGRFRQRRVV